MSEKAVTVFTPAYNRGYIIENLYKSLLRQSCKDFEWLVIDDGSADNTGELFDVWTKADNGFDITYLKVPNGGKHRAINKGVNLAQGRLFFIVDSDDRLTDDAVELILTWEKSLPQNESFAGVAGACGNTTEKMIGTGHGSDFVDCTSQNRKNYGITGDKAEVFYTRLLKEFPFPEFEGENFLTESVVWFAIGAAGYKIRWYNRIIYIGDYLPDGLSAGSMNLFYNNPQGYLLALKSDLANLQPGIKQRLSCIGAYKETGKKLGMTTKEMSAELGVSALLMCFASILRNAVKKLRQLRNG